MKVVLGLLLALLFGCAHTPVAPVVDVASTVQMEVVEMGMLPTNRPSTLNVWFLKGTCAALNEKQLCLADAVATNKVVVLSHGAMGSARGLSWLGEKLAAAGHVVLGINHFEESSIYGKESQNPRATSVIWQRPQDISALLDKLVTKGIFQKPVDYSNVIAIGHSSGGQTAAMLAGATFDLQQLTDYCASSEQSKGDVSCGYGGGAGSAPTSFKKQFSTSHADARVKAIVLLDPALGSAVQVTSLRKINIPTLVVGAENNDFLPWKQHGLRYASEIPNAKINSLKSQEGHFVFISACSHKTKVMGISLCEDRGGVDRKAVQELVFDGLIAFVRAQG